MKKQITLTAIQYTPETEAEIVELMHWDGYYSVSRSDTGMTMRKDNGEGDPLDIFPVCLTDWVLPNFLEEGSLLIMSDEFFHRQLKRYEGNYLINPQSPPLPDA